MTQEMFLKDTWPLIDEKLKMGADVTINPGGISMKPLVIPGRDSVILTKLPLELKKYDVVLYIRENGQFVLHRVVGKRDGKFIMCGDNQYWWEYDVKKEQLLALMKGVIRNGKEISINSFSYKLYSRVWVRLQRIKFMALRVKRKLFKKR